MKRITVEEPMSAPASYIYRQERYKGGLAELRRQKDSAKKRWDALNYLFLQTASIVNSPEGARGVNLPIYFTGETPRIFRDGLTRRVLSVDRKTHNRFELSSYLAHVLPGDPEDPIQHSLTGLMPSFELGFAFTEDGEISPFEGEYKVATRPAIPGLSGYDFTEFNPADGFVYIPSPPTLFHSLAFLHTAVSGEIGDIDEEYELIRNLPVPNWSDYNELAYNLGWSPTDNQ